MWGGLANVAQFAGVDAVALITKIKQMARTASQNRADCEDLAGRVDLLADLLSRLRDDGPSEPAATRTMAGLTATLAEAHDLVVSCQGRGRTYHFFNASRNAERFRSVERRIDSYLHHFNAINNIAINRIARRLDGLIIHTDNGASAAPRTNTTIMVEDAADEAEELTLAEITVVTNNFAVVLGSGDSGTVYKGRLYDGREVAVKRLRPGRIGAEDAFGMELAILAPLRHQNIVRLVGRCADDGERIVVTQLMSNGSLHDHIHGHRRQPSPVTSSWKARVQVLLGVARGVEHLHSRAMPLDIHGGVTSSHVLLGDNPQAPRLTGFGASVWRAAGVNSQPVAAAVGGRGVQGYADPEFLSTGRIKPASDVYGVGVVMLETLTGKPSMVTVWDERSSSMAPMTLVTFALPSVQAGRLLDVLDRRPAAEMTSWQMEPLQLVASTAARCLSFHGDNRPGISEVVADLERALQLICSRGHF